MKRILIISLLNFINPTEYLLSQGEYLQRGQSGIAAGIAYAAASNNISGFGGAVGFSYLGLYDFGVAVINNSSNNTIDKSVTISPSLTVHATKKENVYAQFLYSADLSYHHTEVYHGYAQSTDVILIGFSIYADLDASEGLHFQPSAGVEYLQNFSGKGNSSIPLEYLAGLPFYFNFSSKSIEFIEPAVAFNNNNFSFGISAGLVFITDKQEK